MENKPESQDGKEPSSPLLRAAAFGDLEALKVLIEVTLLSLTRAGHLRYFWGGFFYIEVPISFKPISCNLFLHQPTPSQITFIENEKSIIFH